MSRGRGRGRGSLILMFMFGFTVMALMFMVTVFFVIQKSPETPLVKPGQYVNQHVGGKVHKIVGNDAIHPHLPENKKGQKPAWFSSQRKGCTYKEATNYDKKAEVDDGSCEFIGDISVRRWRDDGRCGKNWPAPGAEEAECHPFGESDHGPCCSSIGWCGESAAHCDCPTCKDYRKYQSQCSTPPKTESFLSYSQLQKNHVEAPLGIPYIPTPGSKFSQDKREPGVSIAAHLTFNRLDRLDRIIAVWKGPVVASVIVSEHTDEEVELQRWAAKQDDRVLVRAWHRPSSLSHLYPVNSLRHQVLTIVPTDLAFLVDVDMVPDVGLYDYLVAKGKKMREKGDDGTLWAVPVFVTKSADVPIPTDKDHLLRLVQEDKAEPILKVEPRAHMRFVNYTHWYSTHEDYRRPWALPEEPYVVINLDNPCTARFDDRFIFYGHDKTEWNDHMDAVGFKYGVIADHFVTHMHHPRAKWGQHQHTRWRPMILELIGEARTEQRANVEKMKSGLECFPGR